MKNKKKVSFAMFLVTIGIVYGDIGTSPLYVLKSIVEGNGGLANINSDFIIGSLSLIIWTITLLTTIKYVVFALKADNGGEGGIFSLYALVKKCAKWLIVPAMLGGAALLADGILTPAVTITTAVEGLRSIEKINLLLGENQSKVVLITLAIISILFIVQQAGTSKIGKMFGPVMLIWFLFLGAVGLIKMTSCMSVLKAFNPIYAIKLLFSPYNKKGFMILGSIFLAATGAEALYSDMGHVGRENIYFSWPIVKICLILNYLGQGAWLITNQSNAQLLSLAEEINPFFMMLPEYLRPIAILLSTSAAVIASQALITGSYTLVSEAILLDLMPHLKIDHPSTTKGQIYIRTVNTILWIGCCAVVLYFRSSARTESAYGLAITITMLMTTLLLSVYLRKIRGKSLLSFLVLFLFGTIEAIFFISSLSKFLVGGYITIIIALLILLIMIIWKRATALESKYSVHLQMKDYIPNLQNLHDDESIPLISENLVFIENGNGSDKIDRDILYSILNKDPKRARAYWFISVTVDDKPNVSKYHVETYGTDFIFRVHINVGYKVPQSINVYLRQIVNELIESGELPPQIRLFSMYSNSKVGNFKFCTLKKAIPSSSEDLSKLDLLTLKAKYFIRSIAGSRAAWYGLDTSLQIVETVPFVISSKHADEYKVTRE